MLFSATMPDPIITLARTFMNQPTHIRAEAPHSAATHDTTEQFAYRAHALDKSGAGQSHPAGRGPRRRTMIFTRTKRTAQKVSDELAERGFKVDAVHGDPGPGCPREGLEVVPHRRRRRPGRNGCRGARYRHRRRHARHQLPVPRGRAGLRAPHRTHRPRRQDRCRDHPRRLGRTGPVGDDRQGAEPGLPRSGRNLFQLTAHLRGAGHPERCHRPDRRTAQGQGQGQAQPRREAHLLDGRGSSGQDQDPQPPAYPRRRVGHRASRRAPRLRRRTAPMPHR